MRRILNIKRSLLSWDHAHRLYFVLSVVRTYFWLMFGFLWQGKAQVGHWKILKLSWTLSAGCMHVWLPVYCTLVPCISCQIITTLEFHRILWIYGVEYVNTCRSFHVKTVALYCLQVQGIEKEHFRKFARRTFLASHYNSILWLTGAYTATLFSCCCPIHSRKNDANKIIQRALQNKGNPPRQVLLTQI